MVPTDNISETSRKYISAWPADCIHLTNRAKAQKGDKRMMAQPYVDGITDTVAHSIVSSLTANQIAADQDTVLSLIHI